MSRIAAKFAALKAQGRTALVPFITAGDPSRDITVPLMQTLVENGADIIELGVPFSDPMADGPVIQRASERALQHHTSLHDVLEMVQAFRETDSDTPVVLMGYLNPIEIMGYEAFAEAAQAAGVDGVLTVDIPPEEGNEFIPAMQRHGLDPIYLLAPTSTPQRIEKITGSASGFVYYVSLKGVTGAASLDVAAAADKLAHIRAATALPVGVGFGIKDAATAAAMGAVADAVVVGSAIVSRVEEHADNPARIHESIAELVAGMRAALDANS
jgi:tryptophan synthase alpha chain